jgi:hypothetical protein
MDWESQDPLTLAICATNSLVLNADPFTQGAAPDYWTWCKDLHEQVVAALSTVGGASVAELVARLTEHPDDAATYRRLVLVLAACFDPADDVSRKLGQLAWEADSESRLRVHVGDRFGGTGRKVEMEQLLAQPAADRQRSEGDVDAAVIIPFRDRDSAGTRALNLAACLHALNDQSYPRDRYRIVVVETDDAPRWRDVLGAACDAYIFCRNPRLFNKAWAVNVGVVHGGRPTKVVCVLDADILVDHSFVERNVARFHVPGAQAHWSFQDLLCLDEASSHVATRSRCLHGQRSIDHRTLRGVYLRRPPGGCLWLRERLFTRVGGMDERLEGWGGEDMDFVWRVELYGSLDRHQDPLMHLNHQRAPHRADDGQPFYRDIRWCSWPPDAVIGQLMKYSGTEVA